MGQRFEKYAPLVTSLFTFIVYLFTMSRGVMPIDAGELAASQYTLGISHPSGYPLFNLVGFLWSQLPIGSVIFRLNLLCAIWVALANFFMVKTAFLILKHSFIPAPAAKSAGNKKNQEIAVKTGAPVPLQLIAAISGILVVAFCKTWWIQSAGVEVYSLQIALLAAFFFLFMRTCYKPSPLLKDWLFNGLMLGLCFTNHLTAVLILPGVVVLFLVKMKLNIKALKMGFVMAGGFALVFLAFYGCMMWRAGSSPLVNYGNPSTMEYLKRHVTGWQYQSFMGANNNQHENAFVIFFSNFTHETGVIGLLLLFAGMAYTCTKQLKMAAFWGLNFFAALIYAAQYDIHDIESYFLLSYMSACVFMAFAIYWLLGLVKGIEKNKAVYLILLLPILPLAINYKKTDQSNLHYIDAYTVGALHSVEKNAIIISREWNEFVGPAYYYHLVEKQRPDVLILDKEMLRRSWYYNQIKAWDKEFAQHIEQQAIAFNEAVLPFERKQKFNPEMIQQKFEVYITAILSQYKNRPVYISPLVVDADIAKGIDVKLPPGSLLVPDAYFYKVIDTSVTHYSALGQPLEYNVNFTDKKEDEFQLQILTYTMHVLSARVQYEMMYGKKAEARKIVELMQTIDDRVTMPEGL